MGQETVQEKQELGNKRQELEALRRHLARMERILSKLRVEIGTLKKMYAEILAPRIRELDDLNKRLSNCGEFPGSEPSVGEDVYSSSFSSAGENEITGTINQSGTSDTYSNSTDSFKDLYRRVAKAIHPDLATNEEERKWRQKLMAEANNAYANKDRESLRTILRQWESARWSRADSDDAAEFSLLQRKICWVMERIRTVEAEIEKLRETDLFNLLLKIEEAQYEGIDLLAEMAKNIDASIESARRQLRRNTRAACETSSGADNDSDNFRTVSFRSSQPVGMLFVRHSDSESFLDWKSIGEARGEVSVAEGKALRLDIVKRSPETTECLHKLGPHDLQALFLHGSNDAELACLRKLAGLRELYLSGDGITDTGLASLLNLKGLRRLYIYDTSVSAAGAETLQALRELRCITFCGPGITDKALQKIKQSLPDCRIIILNHQKDTKQ